MLTNIGNIGYRAQKTDEFSPLKIDDLLVWYDASDSDSITHTSGSVAQWNDKSGNGHHAVQSTTSCQPVYDSSSFNQAGGIIFDGSDDYLDISSITQQTIGDEDPYTVFVVLQNDNETDTTTSSSLNTALALGEYSSSTEDRPKIYVASQRDYPNKIGSYSQGTGSTSDFWDTSCSPLVYSEIVQSGENGTVSVYDGLTQKVSDSGNTGRIDPDATYGLRISGDSSSSSRIYNGIIGAIIIYTRALSINEQVKVVNYLNGIYLK